MGKRAWSCGLCGVPIDVGMKVFSITEMFLVLLHFKVMFDVALEAKALRDQGCPTSIAQFLRVILCLCLVVQCVSAFLLYFIGNEKRNTTICWIWIGVSIATVFSVELCIIFVHIWITEERIYCQRSQRESTIFSGIIELYLIYGIWLVFEYIQWIRNGRAVGELVEEIVENVQPLLEEVFQGPQKQSKTSQPSKTPSRAQKP